MKHTRIYHIISRLLLTTLLLTSSWASAQAAETSAAYVVLSTDYSSLTFYFDGNQGSHSEGTAILVEEMLQNQQFMMNRASITTVTIDASFSGYSPTSTASWFSSMSQLTMLDLSNLVMANVTNTDEMFNGCSSLKTIIVNESWPSAQNGAEGTITPDGSGSSISGSNMFNGCRSLEGGAGTTYDASHVDYTYAHIDGGTSNPGYFTAATEDQPSTDESNLYPPKSIVWRDITWKNANNRKDKDNNDLPFLMGSGLGYKTLLAESFYSEAQGTNVTRPYYTYIDHEAGEKGVPGVGLYYKFTPKVSGQLRFNTWVNKGNRKTFIIKASDGTPLEPYVDYTFDGYLNGQNQPETGYPLYFTADEIKSRHDESGTVNKYVVVTGQAFWGWITVNLNGGESYYIYQQSSQLGFGGYDFTPVGGTTESYVSCIRSSNNDGTFVLSPEFAAVVDENGRAMNVDEKGSLVKFGTTNMDVEALGSAEVESVEADFDKPYAVLSDNNTVLTFYYDNQKETRGGMDVGPFNIPGDRGWESAAASVTTVVFDQSMANCTSLTSTAHWFYGFQALTTIRNIGYLKTDNVTDMQYMFHDCNSLTNIELAGFNTANVTNMRGLFYKCQQLQAIDLSSFNTAKVTDVSWMFYGCNAVTTIYVGSSWALPERLADEDGAMFNNCTNLKGGAGTTYDVNHIDHAYAHIDGGESNPGYFTDKNAVASNLEIYSVDKSVTYVANQSINPTQSIIMTPGNDSEWKTDLAIGLTNTTTGESNDPLEFKASIYYPNSTVTFSFLPAMRGTLNPRDGNLTNNADTGEVENTGSAYVPGYKNLPKSGAYIVYEALQNGSLIIPIRVTADKSLFVVTGDGNPVVDIQFKDSTGTTQVLNAEPLCSVASEYVMGFVSFNVEKGQKYYVFCNASKPRIAGYIFSTEAITIDQETMKNVRDILQPAPIQDMELFAVDATTAVTPNEPIQVTRSVTMTPGEDSAWGVRLLENSTTSYEFDASKYYPTSTSKYTFWGSTRGTNSAKDGALTEGKSTGQTYNYTLKNSPQSGAYMTFEASQNGSLIIPLHVPLNKPLYVLDGNGKAKTDIQFINLLGQAVPMLAEPLCMFSETETTSGFLSFNVNQGEKYTIFINDGADLRFGGYVFSPESITIDPATMANVKSILDAEPYAAFNNDSTVLTFYYDDQKTAKKGMDVGPFINTVPSWNKITKAVFDASFANCTTLTSTAWWFYDCYQLTTIEGIENLNTANVTDMTRMFDGCEVLTDLNLKNFNTANVTDMTRMFYDCHTLKDLDVSSFNTANVRKMRLMFGRCSGLTSLDLGSFNTANVTNMGEMFSRCSNLETITVSSGWSVENVESGTSYDGTTTGIGVNMFMDCTKLRGAMGTTYDANHVDIEYAHIDGGESNPGYFTAATGNAEPYAVLSDNNTVLTFFYDDQKQAKGGMDVGPFVYDSKDKRGWSPYTSQITKAVFDQSFDQCTTLTSTAFWFTYLTQLETIEHIEYLHTDNVEDMNCMFDSCYVLRDLDVSHFVTAKVRNMQCMFNRCEALTSLNLSNFNTSSCTFMRGMFYDCKGLTSLDLSSFNTSNNTSTEYMFQLCSSLENIIFGSGFSTENVTNMRGMFDGCSSLKSLNIGGFNTQKVSLMSIMFRGCSSLTSLDVSSFNTANVTDMVGMFMQCSGLTSLDLSKFNTEKVTNMSYMFNECSQLTSLNLSSFNTANVVNMRAMFQLCSSLTNLDLSNFNTQNVTDMSYMFSTCSGLTNPNMKSFNTSNVTEMYAMFASCSALTTLDMSSFSTANVTDMGYMFYENSSLASIQAGNAVIPDSIYAQIGNPNLLLYVNEASQTPRSVRNVVVLDVAEQIVLKDTVGNNNFFCPKQFTAKRISYTHNYKQATQVGVSRGWETIALPFSVQTITHEKNGTLVPFGVDGGKPFWLRELTENGLISAQRIEAYVPYLISMPNNSIYPADYNQAGNVTFSATDAVVAVTEQRSASGNNRTLIPTCQRVEQSANVYAINLNEAYESNPEGSIFVANYREVRPFEAYVEHPNGGARYYTLGDLADMDVTSLQAIHNIVASDFVKVYNLSGVLVKSGKRHEVIPYLTKGVYIINGSKVVIK